MSFTELNPDVESSYKMGYVFNILVVMMIAINFSTTLKEDLRTCYSYVKRAYERRQKKINQ
jgi:hypothetical protein